MKISVIELEDFKDIIYFLHSRLTTMNISSSILCTKSTCFTVVSGGNEYLFVIRSPYHNNPSCRFAYVDESGNVRCSLTPPVGKPVIIVINVNSIREAESLSQALAFTS